MAHLSFSNYDSADKPTIEASITHAESNPFLLSRFQDVMIYRRGDVNVEIREPRNVLTQFMWMLEPFLTTEYMPDSEMYMPERTAKRLYDSHDFWYVCMMVNGCASVTEYNMGKMLVLPVDQLYRLEAILFRAKNTQTAISEGDDSVIFK